jgi:hypothetical protein
LTFSNSIIFNVNKKAEYTCCWCKDGKNKVEIHHIKPLADGGQDIEDNAAPLCSNCHTLFGDNPKMRKQIKERREDWYDTCKKRKEFSWSSGLLIPHLDSFEHIFPSQGKSKSGTAVRDDWPRLRLFCQHDKSAISPFQILIGYYPEIYGGNNQ